VVGSTMMVNKLLEVSLQNIQSKVDINVYFVVDADQAAIDSLKTSLEGLPDVAEVTFTSREEALAQFQQRHQNDETIMQGLEELGDNPLGASLSIRARETSQYEGIAAFLNDQRGLEDPQRPLIDDVNYVKNKEAIDKLTNIINAVEHSTTIAMIVLVAASVLITFNTIRLAIYTSREEISVMRLVGASNTFIRGPFMLQGVMYGVVSGVLALLMLYPIILWLGPETESFFQFNLFNYFVSDFARIFGILIGSGVALGMVSSIMAVTRYLHV
jgi:cell division transport system permease protein